MLLFAIREVTQESTGFSPAELVFGHSVRGDLKLLKEKWLGCESSPTTNLLNFVTDFRFKLSRACELANETLGVAQKKMKSSRFKQRVFSPGGQVLVLLPLPGSALQAQYIGPYAIEWQVGQCDYMVRMPGCKCKTQLCHVNLLKPYVARSSRSSEIKPAAVLTPPSLSSVPLDSIGATGESEVNNLTEVSCARLSISEILSRLDTYTVYHI